MEPELPTDCAKEEVAMSNNEITAMATKRRR
jgi:hypothetical protein